MKAYRAITEAFAQSLSEDAVEVLPGKGGLALIAEHAGNEIPPAWNNLRLPSALLDTHYAVDIGLDWLTRNLSKRLDSPAALSRYSRLFLDYNRAPGHRDRYRADMGGIPVPGNGSGILSIECAEARIATADRPVAEAIEEIAENRTTIALHSFTPIMSGLTRKTAIGVMAPSRDQLADTLIAAILREFEGSGLPVDFNQPYAYEPDQNQTLERHGRGTGRPFLQIEVNNDLIQRPDEDFACKLAAALLSIS